MKIKDMNPEQIKEHEQTMSDLDYWQQYGDLVGWRVIGWTRRDSALFAVNERETCDLTRHHVDLIEAAKKATWKECT